MMEKIQSILPHRSPFLFVNRIISVEPGKSATAEYFVSPDWPVFRGHFPDDPVMPGVLIVEMMAQSGALALLCAEEMRGRVAYLAAIDSARFKRPVRPGDTLRAHTQMGPVKRGIGRATGVAYVNEVEVARAAITFALPQIDTPKV